MVFDIGRFILNSYKIISDTIFEEDSYAERIIGIVSDYDTGTYEIEESKDFMSGFYNRRYNLILIYSTDLADELLEIDIENTIEEGMENTIINNEIVDKLLETASLVQLSKINLEDCIQPEHLEAVQIFCLRRKVTLSELKLV
mmetsp:Transcript_27043/g.23877  ORF Transcript_27043/g.23877 Transcript_27043/m.23877 type:complete len:143 (+) Transcript_27043:597-1025(+)